MGRRSIHRVQAVTGTPNRMPSLPYINITNSAHHQPTPHQLIVTSDEARQTCIDQYALESCNRKCVYSYDDKYSFTRIITSDSLVFDSHFESGNLHSAFRVLNSGANATKVQTYDLYLHSDVNTIGHTQWFYFSVSNVRQGQEVTFVIRNFSKSDSLFNDGMRPLIYSSKSGRGWERCGTNISYFSSQSKTSEAFKLAEQAAPADQKKKQASTVSYILCFTHVFEFAADVCFFSYCHPYTYTDLQLYLNKLSSNRVYSKYLRRSVLCRTYGNNKCDLLTITAPAKSPEELNRRVTVVLTARVHPGESNSSWIMEGMLDFLLQDSDEAQLLREAYVFKVVPMLNPDGVINGNNRKSLTGFDLNRKWINPDKTLHPTIFHTKELIKKLNKIRPVGVMLDLHGHSQRQGVFIYGCVPERRLLKPLSPSSRDTLRFIDPYFAQMQQEIVTPTSLSSPLAADSETSADACLPRSTSSRRDLMAWRVKLLPRIFNATIPSFSIDSCSFKMHRAKASTMRMVAFTELGVDCVYTVEASLAGKDPCHFGAHDLLQLGRELTVGILAAYPSVAPRSSAFYSHTVQSSGQQSANMMNAKAGSYAHHQLESQLDNSASYLNNTNGSSSLNISSIDTVLNSFSVMMPFRRLKVPLINSCRAELAGYFDEMLAWRRYYDPLQNIGKQLLSEQAVRELYEEAYTGPIERIPSADSAEDLDVCVVAVTAESISAAAAIAANSSSSSSASLLAHSSQNEDAVESTKSRYGLLKKSKSMRSSKTKPQEVLAVGDIDGDKLSIPAKTIELTNVKGQVTATTTSTAKDTKSKRKVKSTVTAVATVIEDEDNTFMAVAPQATSSRSSAAAAAGNPFEVPTTAAATAAATAKNIRRRRSTTAARAPSVAVKEAREAAFNDAICSVPVKNVGTWLQAEQKVLSEKSSIGLTPPLAGLVAMPPSMLPISATRGSSAAGNDQASEAQRPLRSLLRKQLSLHIPAEGGYVDSMQPIVSKVDPSQGKEPSQRLSHLHCQQHQQQQPTPPLEPKTPSSSRLISSTSRSALSRIYRSYFDEEAISGGSGAYKAHPMSTTAASKQFLVEQVMDSMLATDRLNRDIVGTALMTEDDSALTSSRRRSSLSKPSSADSNLGSRKNSKLFERTAELATTGNGGNIAMSIRGSIVVSDGGREGPHQHLHSLQQQQSTSPSLHHIPTLLHSGDREHGLENYSEFFRRPSKLHAAEFL